MSPVRCVVDTNVAVTANGGHDAATAECRAASARALYAIMQRGHLFLDQAGEIVAEYRAHLEPFGRSLPGNAFLKWVLTHEWGGQRVTRVPITPNAGETGFDELPPPTDGTRYDPSDCKFLAVAAAHPEHPVVLQALDSKWLDWTGALRDSGVEVHFVCPDDIQRLHTPRVDE